MLYFDEPNGKSAEIKMIMYQLEPPEDRFILTTIFKYIIRKTGLFIISPLAQNLRSTSRKLISEGSNKNFFYVKNPYLIIHNFHFRKSSFSSEIF